MKKLLIGLTLYIAILIGAVTVGENLTSAEINVIEKNGFKVLDNGDSENITTIACETKSLKQYGMRKDKYGVMVCTNVFDKLDLSVLTEKQAKGVKIGDILLITYKGDHVIKVKKNDLKIGNKIDGQKIN